MKRSIIVLIVAGAMLLALPATAKKPPKPPQPPTEPPPVLVCDFDEAGKLAGYTGTESAPYKCEWTITDAEVEEYSFVLKAVSGTPSVLRPHLFVTDAYPTGDKCFDQMDNGWHALPYTFGPFTPPPEDVSCNSPTYNITDAATDDPDNVYSLIIAARAKGAPLELWLVKP